MKSTTVLTHDTAFVYDLLSIAAVKVRKNPNSQLAFDSYIKLVETLREQHGQDDHLIIVDSPEYKELFRINEEMYTRIDECKTRAATGEDFYYIDDRVYERWLAKKKLQEKFFLGASLSEQKFGYK